MQFVQHQSNANRKYFCHVHCTHSYQVICTYSYQLHLSYQVFLRTKYIFIPSTSLCQVHFIPSASSYQDIFIPSTYLCQVYFYSKYIFMPSTLHIFISSTSFIPSTSPYQAYLYAKYIFMLSTSLFQVHHPAMYNPHNLTT